MPHTDKNCNNFRSFSLVQYKNEIVPKQFWTATTKIFEWFEGGRKNIPTFSTVIDWKQFVDTEKKQKRDKSAQKYNVIMKLSTLLLYEIDF